MDNKEEINKELQELSTFLAGIQKQNPFRVPDYYFQSLANRTLDRIKARPVLWTDKLESVLNRFFSVIFRPRYAVPGAAVLIALAAGISLLKNASHAPVDDWTLLAEISSGEISQYALENFDDEDLLAFIGSAGNADHVVLGDISREELEDFFKNESDNQISEEDFL